MTTSPPTETPHEAAANAFAGAVLAFLETEDRPFEWLARRSNIHSSTLRSQLIEKPTRLSYVNAVRIARVVPVPLFEDVTR